MGVRNFFARIGIILVLITAGSLVIGGVTGTPVGLSYVKSGSMQPTLAPGDGFVAIPSQLAGRINEGHVVTFRNSEGELTTHRIVGETNRGYITRGDANPFTDQAAGQAPVKREQIHAVALQVNGHVVVIPHLGDIVTSVRDMFSSVQRQLAIIVGTRALLGTQGLAYLLFVGSVCLYIVDIYLSSRGRDRTRTRSRDTGRDPRLVIGILTVVIVLSATASMALPAGPQEVQFDSVEDTTWNSGIEAGHSRTLNYTLSNNGFVPVTVLLEPDDKYATVNQAQIQLDSQGQANATVTLTAPDQPGRYRAYIIQYRYLTVFPSSSIVGLHRVHPWLPVVVIDALIAVPFYLVGVRLLGTGRVRSRSRDGPSRLGRLWRRYL